MPRGALRTEVIGWLRLGHANRRPPEVEERLIPGHWEGDLIKGTHNCSAVGTLVERSTLFTVLAKMDNPSTESAVKGFGHVQSDRGAEAPVPDLRSRARNGSPSATDGDNRRHGVLR